MTFKARKPEDFNEDGVRFLGLDAQINPSEILHQQILRCCVANSSGDKALFINSVQTLHSILACEFEKNTQTKAVKAEIEVLIKELDEDIEDINSSPGSFISRGRKTEMIGNVEFDFAQKLFAKLIQLAQILGIWFGSALEQSV